MPIGATLDRRENRSSMAGLRFHSSSIALASALATSVLGLAPSTAGAGEYTVHACRTPDAAVNGGVGDWRATTKSPGNRHGVLCPGGPFTLEMPASSRHTADDWAKLTFTAPRDTEIRDYALWRSVQLARPYNYRALELTRQGRVERERCFSRADGCSSKGTPGSPLAKQNLFGVGQRAEVTGLEFLLSCGEDDSGSTACPATAPGARFQLHRADITLLDRLAPTIQGNPSGPLVDPSAPVTGVQAVRIAATDRGGGVYTAAAEIDGRIVSTEVIDPNGGSCHRPFTADVPCKLSAAGTLTVDTSRLEDGRHPLRLLVTDATETNVAEWGPVRITTANDPCAASPAVKTFRVAARFRSKRGEGSRGRSGSPRRRSKKVVTVRAGRRLRVSGRLTTSEGRPVAGATLCVVGRAQARDAASRRYGTVATDSKGRFSYRIGAGPSRRVSFVYRVPGGAATASVRVRVRARAKLRPSRRSLTNGQSVVLRGRLRGNAPRGTLVELQARRVNGWQTFATARTRRKGRFRYRYHFIRTSGTQRYVLRARVPRQSTYPYATGASRAVAVYVHG
jgi:hypothetical protein